MIARSAQTPADAPRQPMCARERALSVPSAALVKYAQVRQKAMRGCIEVRGLFRDSLTELLELTVHEDWLSGHSDIGAHESMIHRSVIDDRAGTR